VLVENKNHPIMLYVGCGNHRLKGFLHVEVNVGKQFKKGGDVGAPDILADITKHIPLESNSVSLIFSRATLEHLTFTELINHFIECHRLLKKGGVVRMLVPDFDIMIKNYMERSENLEQAIRETEVDPLIPIENHTDLFIQRVLYHDHFYLHNFDTLSRLLTKCGFSEIVRSVPGDSAIVEAREQLLAAEKGRDRYEVLIEAKKLDGKPVLQRTETAYPKKPILRFLAKYLNIELRPFMVRRPAFPSRKWFLEKKMQLTQKF
jgi:predicted SAM-dependent methyltransferase